MAGKWPSFRGMWTRRVMKIGLLSVVCAGVGVAGCGPSEAELAAAKAAADKKKAEEAAMEARLAEKRAEREAAKKAKEAEEKAYAEKVDKLCVVPEKLPKDLKKACDVVAQENDAFMTRMYTGEALERWQKAKQMQLGMTTAQCNKTGSVKVAACQATAMRNAGEDLKKGLPDLMRRCIEKYKDA